MIHTRRWCDPAHEHDGFRVLVSRYRPRGVLKEQETWDGWMPQLGPSKALHAAFYGKAGAPIDWQEYAARYVREMEAQTFWIRALAAHATSGKALTLLCSSACVDPARCHRSLLSTLIEAQTAGATDPSPTATTVRRRSK